MFNFDVNQLTEQMKPAMDKFATTLGTTADKLLEIGVKGMFVEGLYAIVVCLISVVVFIVSSVVVSRAAKALANANNEPDITPVFVKSMLFGFLAAVGMIVSPIAFLDNLKTAVINTAAPDYALLLKVSSLILNKTP